MNYISHLNTFFERAKGDNTLAPTHISLYLALFHYWNVNRFDNPFPVYRDDLMQLSKIGSKNTYHKCIRELHQAGYIQYYPAPFKYLPVAISMIRFDNEVEKNTYQQLNMFSPKNGTCKPIGTSTDFDTSHVPLLGSASIKNDTRQVSKVVLLYKHINFKQLNSVCNTPTKKNNKKNVDKKSNNISSATHSGKEQKENVLPRVPKSVHVPTASSSKVGEKRMVPTLQEVEDFFRQHNYPHPEAKKFFYYNQGKAWMISESLPVTDWKPIAHKWMLNTKTQKQNNNDRTPQLHTPRDKNYSEPL
ncbi:hypothetical protein OCK74_27290 [Chitinophagaceae bacterium LB-8]|uniref:Uncharacterized protein n=1 Tax=Paraflavisolibacter caeni TaxID=2982496 RepID=A0A9X2XQ71_9BACT|nr:hypothetical protein [Paraflavisolibacter caeni]MCU7552854.1 hypothetical protein [Paraflavisolibacter caeni]